MALNEIQQFSPGHEAGIEQAQGKLWLPKPALKAAAELIKIFLEIVQRNAAKTTVDAFFHGANYDVHRRQISVRLKIAKNR